MSASGATHPMLQFSRAKRLASGLLGLALLMAAASFIGYLRQPRYQGVTLNAWLREFDHAWDESIFADFRSIPTNAVIAIRSMGPAAIPELMNRLRKEDSMIKVRANQLLEKQSLVESRFKDVRQNHSIALLAFQALGEGGAGAVPELAAMLEQPATAERAVDALGCIGRPALPVLLRSLAHTNSQVRLGAVAALMSLTPITTEALSGILPLTEDPVPRVRQYAVSFVGLATNHLTRTLPVLVGKLKDADKGVRHAAISSFRRAGDRGREHIPILLELMCGNPVPSDFMAVHHELKALGADEAVETPCLIHGLDSSDGVVRNQAIGLLSLQGRAALPALPRLRQMMEQTADKTERERLSEAVARIESPEKFALAHATNLPPRRSSRRSR